MKLKKSDKTLTELERDWDKIMDFSMNTPKSTLNYAMREDDHFKGETVVSSFMLGDVPINIRFRELTNKKTGKKASVFDVV